jgi:glucan phosphoethanolaminetransferase (alkaline phosphatase superfamily)
MRIAFTRGLVSLFWLTTALYALLSAIPFASQQFLEPQLVPAVTAFATWHSWLSLVALALTAVGLAPWLRVRHPAIVALLGGWAFANVAAFATGGLITLKPSALALAVSMAALVPPVWLALLDLRRSSADVVPDRGTSSASSPAGDFLACAAAAILITTTHAALVLSGEAGSSTWLGGLGRSAILHLLVFSTAFAIISVVRGVAQYVVSGFSRTLAAAVEAWLARAVLAALFAVFMQRVVLSSLSFGGDAATAVAVAFGAALAVMLAPAGTRVTGGVEAAFGGVVPRWATASPVMMVLWVVLAMGAVAGLELAVAGSDWNFTVAKLIALASWVLALATGLRIVSVWLRPAAPRPILTLAPFAACLVILGIQQFAVAATADPSNGANSSWISHDVSSRLIADTLAPTAPTDAGLYEYLQANTNISRTTHVEPVSVEFAELSGPSVRRPHIFMFVVDSLRRDYLSPYNPKVSFTPSIARFAAESTVFEKAFTRYGGTGLSVPSIWAGGLILHKQYVTPFAPMNTLSKLLAAEDYQQAITMEHIIETVLPANIAAEVLDMDIPVRDHRFCRTLQDLRGRLDGLTASGRPAFVYSLPQDIHISAITREGSAAVDDRDYDGFHAAYASRVRRMDACFGDFVADLEARGLYDDSIIILTSDHGDSLGEEGRMGHAYTIFPEVMQVPLLVHLPAALRSTWSASTDAVAFTSDITPSLYALLGHAPTAPSPIFGRSLFRAEGTPAPARRDAEVVASSYGSVYGTLLDDARRLYIIDAVSLKEHVYELDGSAAGRAVSVRGNDREAGQRAIRGAIEEMSRFYAFRP